MSHSYYILVIIVLSLSYGGWILKPFFAVSKFKRLKKLQLEIAPPETIASAKIDDLLGGNSPELKTLLDEYFAFCRADDRVGKIISHYELTNDNLDNIRLNLIGCGLGWLSSFHYIPLTSIAYAEPLLFYIQSQKKGMSSPEIAVRIMDYWESNIKLPFEPITLT